MPVFRVEKNSNYTTMCNYHLRDQGLSLKGKGLLSMLLSLPDTWNYSVRGLSSITPDGVDGVLTALKELERLGYLERNQQRESNGRMGRAEYVIYEMPRKKPCSESPCTEKPYGERSCSIDLLIELSCILHVSTDYLLMGSGPSKEEVKNDLLSIISELSTIAKKI